VHKNKVMDISPLKNNNFVVRVYVTPLCRKRTVAATVRFQRTVVEFENISSPGCEITLYFDNRLSKRTVSGELPN
jgi:hypothetical protein